MSSMRQFIGCLKTLELGEPDFLATRAAISCVSQQRHALILSSLTLSLHLCEIDIAQITINGRNWSEIFCKMREKNMS